MAFLLLVNTGAGRTIYAVVERRSDGAYWNTNTALFEAYNGAHWADPGYVLPMPEGKPGEYSVLFPDVTGAGPWRVVYYQQAGVSPATSDLAFGDQTVGDLIGTGAYAVVVQIRDGSGNPVAANVTVQQGGVPILWAPTNPGGNVNAFALNAGAYTVLVQTSIAYQVLAPQALLVTGNATVTYNALPQSVTPPAAPGLCVVEVDCGKHGAPLAGCVVSARYANPGNFAGTFLQSLQKLLDTSDAQGIAQLQVVRQDALLKGDGVMEFQVLDPDGHLMYAKRCKVPSAANANLETMV